MSHTTFIESSAVTTAFDWTNMAARHPCFEVSGVNGSMNVDVY